ncbi:hypothetical protein SBA3_1920028 [Candidatus Sulfopaludibacter sp. SbA3]|nr:hypothetical protein SBA3_1920028 [Candidatus Sulfopaludibacter sp. SbA3]
MVQAGSNAQLYEAMYLAANRMGERQGRKALIVVTDWSDLGTRVGLDNVLQAAEESSTILYPVLLSEPRTPEPGGAGEKLIQAIVRKLAQDTGGRNLEVDEDHTLEGVLEQIRRELRAQYLLGYTPSSPAGGDAYRRIEATVKDAGLRVRARTGYGSGSDPGQAAEAIPTFAVTGTDRWPFRMDVLARERGVFAVAGRFAGPGCLPGGAGPLCGSGQLSGRPSRGAPFHRHSASRWRLALHRAAWPGTRVGSDARVLGAGRAPPGGIRADPRLGGPRGSQPDLEAANLEPDAGASVVRLRAAAGDDTNCRLSRAPGAAMRQRIPLSRYAHRDYPGGLHSAGPERTGGAL